MFRNPYQRFCSGFAGPAAGVAGVCPFPSPSLNTNPRFSKLSGAMRFLITSCRSVFYSDIQHMYNSSSAVISSPPCIGQTYLSIRHERYSLANLRQASSLVPLFILIHFRYPEIMCLHSPVVSRIVISSIAFAVLAQFLRGMGCVPAGWRTFVIKGKATTLGSAESFIGQQLQGRRSNLVRSLDNMLGCKYACLE